MKLIIAVTLNGHYVVNSMKLVRRVKFMIIFVGVEFNGIIVKGQLDKTLCSVVKHYVIGQ